MIPLYTQDAIRRAEEGDEGLAPLLTNLIERIRDLENRVAILPAKRWEEEEDY